MKKICVYGGGVIGTSWAAYYALKGLNVCLYDISPERVELAKRETEHKLAFFASEEVGVLNKQQLKACEERIQYTNQVAEAIQGAELIQENGPENLKIKQSIIHTIETCGTDALIATSTSGLLISDIAREAIHPERIVGAHPYNPVHLVPLVELASGEFTSPATVEKVYAFYKSVDKEPIVLKRECRGFVGNRIQAALSREAIDLVSRGVCSVEDIDRAVTFGPGIRWGLIGPHLVMELACAGGIQQFLETLWKSSGIWLEDMAKWTSSPEGYTEKAISGVKEELHNRDAHEGMSVDEVAHFRDIGLVQLLKYHGKF